MIMVTNDNIPRRLGCSEQNLNLYEFVSIKAYDNDDDDDDDDSADD